jgi:hypothetical protein
VSPDRPDRPDRPDPTARVVTRSTWKRTDMPRRSYL